MTVGEGWVKGQLSQKPLQDSSWVRILETFPLNQNGVARSHRSAPQLPRGLNTSQCLRVGTTPQATRTRTASPVRATLVGNNQWLSLSNHCAILWSFSRLMDRRTKQSVFGASVSLAACIIVIVWVLLICMSRVLVKRTVSSDWEATQPEVNPCLLYPQRKQQKEKERGGKKNHISKNKCWWVVRESDYVCLRQIGGNESRDCTRSRTLKQRSLGN